MRISRLFWLLLMLVPSVVFATPRLYETIYIDGQQWKVKGWWPLDYVDSIHFVDFDSCLPDDRIRSTANWGGDVCFWSLDGEWLVLDSVKYEVWNDKSSQTKLESHWEKLSQATLREAFKDYCRDGRIVASWYTHTLKVGRGEVVYADPELINSHLESEMLLEMVEGRLVKRTEFHNRVVVEGVDVSKWPNEQWIEFQKGFLPVLRKHPELDTIDRVFFSVRNAAVDSLGNMTDCEVKTLGKNIPIPDVLAKEFKQYLMNIRPWKVYLFNDEYFTPLKAPWGMPIFLKSKDEN